MGDDKPAQRCWIMCGLGPHVMVDGVATGRPEYFCEREKDHAGFCSNSRLERLLDAQRSAR
jgi:hypothetical protein